MKFGSILSPVRRGHQQPIGAAQLGRSPKVMQASFNVWEYYFKGSSLYACQTLETHVQADANQTQRLHIHNYNPVSLTITGV